MEDNKKCNLSFFNENFIFNLTLTYRKDTPGVSMVSYKRFLQGP